MATVMGSAFGTDGHCRISFATSVENLHAGFGRIRSFLGSAS
jgi:aspartate/methionine/tyrosine aminotransferase